MSLRRALLPIDMLVLRAMGRDAIFGPCLCLRFSHGKSTGACVESP